MDFHFLACCMRDGGTDHSAIFGTNLLVWNIYDNVEGLSLFLNGVLKILSRLNALSADALEWGRDIRISINLQILGKTGRFAPSLSDLTKIQKAAGSMWFSL